MNLFDYCITYIDTNNDTEDDSFITKVKPKMVAHRKEHLLSGKLFTPGLIFIVREVTVEQDLPNLGDIGDNPNP